MDSPEESTEIIRLKDTFSSHLFTNSSASNKDDFLYRLECGKNKSLISGYRSRIHELQRDSKRARIDFENDIDTVRKERKNYKSENAKLRADLDSKAANVAKMRGDYEELLERQQKAVKLCEQRFVKLSEDNKALEAERDQLRDIKEKIETEKTKEIWRLQKELATCRLDKEQVESTYDHECSRTQKLQAQVNALEASMCDTSELEVKVKELEKFRDQYEEDAIMVKMLKAEYKAFPEVQKEYAVLKTRQENMLLLKEKYDAVKQKSERWEERLEMMDRISTENEELKRRLSKWTVATSPASENPRSMEDLVHQLTNLQNTEALLLANQSALQTRVNTLEEALRKKEKENVDLGATLATEKSRIVLLDDKMRRMERKMSLIKTERDHYREIIDTYERDCTVQLPSSLSTRDEKQHVIVVQELEGQCRELESWLGDKNMQLQTALATIQQLEVAAEKAAMVNKASIVGDTDKKVISQLRDQISQLEKKLETVSEEKFQVDSIMERYHLQGAYDPRTTKVVQLGANPTSLAMKERSDEVMRLTEENRRLSERVKMLEENECLIEDLTAQVECNVIKETSSTQQIDELKAKMESAELTNTRLMEAFRKTSNDLRTACYCLTGYQMNVLSGSKYRVTHMFSASPDDYLLFRLDSHSNLELLESPYSATLTDLMDVYLTKQHSLPAFMSALALDLFSKRTISL